MKSSKYLIFVLNLIIFINSVTSESKHKTIKKVINKCCAKGEFVQGIINKTCVKPKSRLTYNDFSDVPLYNKNKTFTGRNCASVYDFKYGIMNNETFRNKSYDYSTTRHSYYLSEDGFLYQEHPNQWNWWMELPSDLFCIDYMVDNNTKILGYSYWSILDSDKYEDFEIKEFSTLYVIGLYISSFFLALTLVVYGLLPGTKTLSEMVQIAYVISTLGSFFFLGIVIIGLPTIDACVGITYVTYFFLLSTFSWMAVMSYDLWSLHRNVPSRNRTSGSKFLSRFAWYSLFAWGVPVVLTIFLITMNHLDLTHVPWIVTPSIGLWSCFIGAVPKMLYLYIPMLILILSNWILFFLTSCNLWSQYKMTAALDTCDDNKRKDHRTLKNRFLVYLKLSIVMGISWVLEVGSFIKPQFELWYVTDFYNILLGFAMFLILVCNKRTFKKLKKRFERNESFTRTEADLIS